MPTTRSNSTPSNARDTGLSAHVIAGARDAESLARRDREMHEANSNSVAGNYNEADGDDDDEDDDDEEEEEVTTRVFEVELTGGSPWATAFLECASEGDLATVTKLLDEGKVELNDVDVDGFTALMIAAAEAQSDVAMELLRRGADVSIRTHEMRSTALHFAAKSGVAQVVEAICVQDPQRIDAQNLDGDTPLVWACTEGRLDAVRVLLRHNANVNVVSHRAMSALICAVMMRESDDSDDEEGDDGDGHDHDHDHDRKREAATGTDEDRAEIVRLLLAKNAKLINYQDRDGSTAMHLAASHGYLQCVKTLLELGADITLRNAIGQTPVEEAEETGLPGKSDVCIAHLRVIWKRLEEEAAARMMAMLEMEESNPNGNTKTASSKKASKKKQKKAKQRRGSKPTTGSTSASTATPAMASSATTGDVEKDVDEKHDVSSGEGSSDDEDDERAADTTSASTPQNASVSNDKDLPTADGEEGKAKETNFEEKDAPQPMDGGVWTTVGRKHNQYLSQLADAAADATEQADENARASDAVPPPKKALPVTPRSKTQQRSASTAAPVVFTSSPASATRSRDGKTGSAGKKVTPMTPRAKINKTRPVTTRAPLPSDAGAYPSSSSTAESPSSAVSTSATASLPMGSPFSTFQSQYNTNRLYERYDDRYAVAAPKPAAASPSRSVLAATTAGVTASSSTTWRAAPSPSPATGTTTRTSDAAFSLFSSASGNAATSSTPAAIWRYAAPAQLQSAHLSNNPYARSAGDVASDNVVHFLVCGLCGDLANDNRQCDNITVSPNTLCLQLYCASCLTRAIANARNNANVNANGATASDVHCTKCRQSIHPHKMQRNAFAHAQASALALAARSTASQLQFQQQQQLHQQLLHQQSTLEEMRTLMHRADEKMHTLDIDPFYLAPGANVAALSVGQLDALEQLHHTALRHITQARVENARATERLRMEEWLKTQRDIFQYTTHTSSSPSTQQR